MPSILNFSMRCKPLNEHGTFSEGDTLQGKVTLALTKQITVESLFIKVTGDATVRWTEKVGDSTSSYSAAHRYFKLKQPLIPPGGKDPVPPGTHVYDFIFQLPTCGMPPSFRGSHGKIVYKVTATLSRSWKLDRTVEQELDFVPRFIPDLQNYMVQQICTTNKAMGFFSTGNVHVHVILNRRAYAPGETIVIVATINNCSSSKMTPKFKIICDVVYRAQGNTKLESSTVASATDKCIAPQSQKTINCALQIPMNLYLSNRNCHIITVEYHLKAYLDISFSFDPKVIFPLLICPHSMIHGDAFGANSPSAFRGQANSDFPPPSPTASPYPAGATGGAPMASAPTPLVAMGPPPYPAAPLIAHGSHPYPQLPSLYRREFSSSSVLHPPPPAEIPPLNAYPTAPLYRVTQPSAPLLNTDFLSQQPPPSYSLLFPDSSAGQSNSKQ